MLREFPELNTMVNELGEKAVVRNLETGALEIQDWAKDQINAKVQSRVGANQAAYYSGLINQNKAQAEVDNALEKFGRIGGGLYDELDQNGFYVDADNKVQPKVPVKEELTEAVSKYTVYVCDGNGAASRGTEEDSFDTIEINADDAKHAMALAVAFKELDFPIAHESPSFEDIAEALEDEYIIDSADEFDPEEALDDQDSGSGETIIYGIKDPQGNLVYDFDFEYWEGLKNGSDEEDEESTEERFMVYTAANEYEYERYGHDDFLGSFETSEEAIKAGEEELQAGNVYSIEITKEYYDGLTHEYETEVIYANNKGENA